VSTAIGTNPPPSFLPSRSPQAGYMHFSSCRQEGYAHHRQKFLNFLQLRQGPFPFLLYILNTYIYYIYT
jgi:hypothetical protein